jgi:hypothetical protein
VTSVRDDGSTVDPTRVTSTASTSGRTPKLPAQSAGDVSSSPAGSSSTCRSCGKPITLVPGKRARVYCSDACKMRAARAANRNAATDQRESGKVPGQRDGARQLGKKSTEFRGGVTSDPDEAAREQARSRRARRYTQRRVLWGVTSSKACKGCGRSLMDFETGLIVIQTAAGYSITLGQYKCARIWLCPVCSATIRNARAEEIRPTMADWIKRGGTVLLVTLTARHTASHALADLLDALQGTRTAAPVDVDAARAELAEARAELADAEQASRAAVESARQEAPDGAKRAAMTAARSAGAGRIEQASARLSAAQAAVKVTARQPGAYQRLISGAAWAGDSRRAGNLEGISGRVGYVGMARATEVTVSLVNGWHPHIHAGMFLGAITTGTGADRQITGTFTPSESALAEFEDHIRQVWTRTLRQFDPDIESSLTCAIPGCKCNGRGHAVDIQRVETVAQAEAFGEYLVKTQDGKDPAAELMAGHNKNGRYAGHMTPFQLLDRIGEFLGGVVVDDDGPSLEWCLARWAEYEQATAGRRAIELTRSLRRLLGIDGGDTEEDDADALFVADALSEFRAGVRIKADAWPKVTARGLDLAVIEAAEGTDGIELGKVAAVVIEQAGADSGSVLPMTGAEVDQAREQLMAKQQARRDEARARREAEATADALTERAGAERARETTDEEI